MFLFTTAHAPCTFQNMVISYINVLHTCQQEATMQDLTSEIHLSKSARSIYLPAKYTSDIR